jgi:ferrous iron transport protein B
MTARVLKSTVLKSGHTPFMLEMPAYRWPTLRSIGLRLLDRSKIFLRRAGTVILTVAVVLWVLAHLPFTNGKAPAIADSLAGTVGRTIEPLIQPLGFNWKIGVGLVSSLAAREVIISTLGLVYGLGKDTEEGSEGLRAIVRDRYSPLVGLSLMVFFLFACQCMSTLAIVRRETGTIRWPLFMFGYMTALAWAASFLVYQGGRALGFG